MAKNSKFPATMYIVREKDTGEDEVWYSAFARMEDAVEYANDVNSLVGIYEVNQVGKPVVKTTIKLDTD